MVEIAISIIVHLSSEPFVPAFGRMIARSFLPGGVNEGLQFFH